MSEETLVEAFMAGATYALGYTCKADRARVRAQQVAQKLSAASSQAHHQPAIDIIRDQLTRPVGREEGWINPDHFDPWEAFPCVYGSYSSEFDDMAILVLENILNRRWGADHGEGLAHQMFREMLCKADLCDYGTSPRGCFPTREFEEVLPALLEKWREYRRVAWEE